MASASTTVTVGDVGDDLAQHGRQAAVDLDRGDRRAGLGEGQRQRAEAGADLDDAVAGADAGEVGDAADGVRVGDEVLPEVAARRQAVARRAARARAGRECVTAGPRLISTWIGASVEVGDRRERRRRSSPSRPAARRSGAAPSSSRWTGRWRR